MSKEEIINISGLTLDEAEQFGKENKELTEQFFMDIFHLYKVNAEQRKTKNFMIYAKNREEAEKICREKIINGSLSMEDAFIWSPEACVDRQYN